MNPRTSRWLSCDPALGKYMSECSNGSSGGIYNSVNLNLYHYAGNNPVRYKDVDGNELISFSITTMQNIGGETKKELPNSNLAISAKGCTFATMAGIIDDYRASHGMEPINWNQMLENSELNDYFVSQADVDSGNTTGEAGDLKRDKFLNDFSDGKLKILENVSGDKVSSTIDKAIADKKKVYAAGRAKVNCGTQGKGEHEVGITGRKEGSELNIVWSSKNDENRSYKTDGGEVGNVNRVIIVGEQ